MTKSEASVMERFERSSPWLALVLLVLSGGYMVAVLAERVLGVHTISDFTSASLLVCLALRELTFLALSAFGAYAILREPFGSLGLRKPRVQDFVLGVAVGAPALIVIYVLLYLAKLPTSVFGYHFLHLIGSASGPTAVLMFLFIAVASPIVQEIVFRGVIMEGLLRETSVPIGLVMSSAVFASVHIPAGLKVTTFAFLTGLVQGWLYWRTRSVVAPSVMHIIANSLATLALFIKPL